MRFQRFGLVVALVCASGCAGGELRRASLPQLQLRASFDLACAPAALQLYQFDERSKGVFGCGQRISYVEVCDHEVGTCTWMIDGQSPAAVSAGFHPAAQKPPGLAAEPPPIAPPPVRPVVAGKPRPDPAEPVDLDIRD